MASGTIIFNKSSLNSSGTYLQGQITYSYSQSASNNTSTISCNVYLRKDNDSINLSETTSTTFTYALNFNGEAITDSVKKEILTDYVLLGSFTRTISHNSDGSKYIPISGYITTAKNTTVVAGLKTTVDTTIPLATIARASSITSAGNVTLGNNCNIKWTPASSSFAYKLKFQSGSVSEITGYITPNTTSSYTYTGYTMTTNKWGPAIDSYTATCTVTLYTYSSSSSSSPIGSSSTTFTLTLSGSTVPEVDFFYIKLINGWNGYYIQGKSQCEMWVTATASAGSELVSFTLTGPGVSASVIPGNDLIVATTDILTQSGTLTYTTVATDGRGTATATESIYVYPYANPLVSITSERSADNTSAKIIYKASCSPVNNKNSLVELKIYKKLASESTWPSSPETTISLSSTSASGEYTITGLDPEVSYEFKGVATDKVGSSSESGSSVASKFKLVNISKNTDGTRGGVAVGKMSESDIFDCALEAHFVQIYAQNDTIVTSDKNVKTDIVNMSDTQEQLFNRLQPVTYKFINGSSGRTHYGFISQDVEDALNSLELTGQDFGGFCKRLRVDRNGEAILDENGNQIYDYALRYGEFIALNTYMIKRLQVENSALRAEIQELKKMITTSSNNEE